MILVEAITYYEVDDNIHEIIHRQLPYEATEVLTKNGEEFISTNLIHELVRGRRFRRPSDGQDLMIGWSEEVADVLGLPLECWEEKEGECRGLRNTADIFQQENIRLKQAGVWQRFKWLFVGIK